MGLQNFPPTLKTERLILRGHRLDDFAESAAMWADPKVVAHISGVPSNEEQSWSRLLRYAGHWHHMGFGYWVVEQKSDGAFIGEVGFSNYRRDTSPSIDNLPEAGWVLNSKSHGKGIATEAVRKIVQWADHKLEASKTVCILDPKHHASINVARKAGYGNEFLGHYRTRETFFMERPPQAGVGSSPR